MSNPVFGLVWVRFELGSNLVKKNTNLKNMRLTWVEGSGNLPKVEATHDLFLHFQLCYILFY